MIDTEKVIKGLEKLRTDLGYGLPDRSNVVMEYLNSLTDALTLIKEKEAVEPRQDAYCPRMFRCGVCGEYVGFIDSDSGDPNEQDNYCRNCGNGVKWK